MASSRRPDPQRGDIFLPRWMALLLVVLSWIAGFGILAFELPGQGRLGVLALAVWCIVWPLVAGNPMEALGQFMGGIFPKSRRD